MVEALSDPFCPLQYELPKPRTVLAGTDPKRVDQWHLKNDGRFGLTGEDLNVEPVWPHFKGRGVRVAVIDDAIELLHEDLWPNVVAGRSYNYSGRTQGNAWPLPCSLADHHGTAVSGLIAARGNNRFGGTGVAWEASLVGYNALATSQDVDVMDALTRDLAANDIYNNSWGSPDDGRLHPAEPSFTTAIRQGIETGRGGKGAIYVFPAGNGGCYVDNVVPPTPPYIPCVRENSNYDGYVNKLGTIAVCAVSSKGYQPFYGENGANILVCAPSSDTDENASVRTTALENGFRDDFTGTSASTPMVSGVIALMLEANPELTWRDVRLILARTARQNDAVTERIITYPGENPGDPPVNEIFEPGWATNFGLNNSKRYGFGVVDAEAAVATAQGWQSVGDSRSLLTCGPYQPETDVDTPLPDHNGDPGNDGIPVSSTIPVPADCAIGHIEFVEIRVSAPSMAGTTPNPGSGDLRIRLTSPHGLVSELADEHRCYNARAQFVSCGDYDDFAFGSVRHLDEPARNGDNGNWTLEITDRLAGATSRFQRWSLTLYGRPAVSP